MTENTNLTLQCQPGTGISVGSALLLTDPGTISKIVFAEFGTPSGTCGAYTPGSCGTKNSQQVSSALLLSCADSCRHKVFVSKYSACQLVEAACLGKTSCVIPATNDFFGGDPCYNVPKVSAV